MTISPKSGEALAKKLERIAEYPSIERVSVHGSPLSGLLREAAALLTEQQNDLEIAQEAAALWRTRLAEKLTDQSRQQEAWEKSYNTILRLIEVAKSEEPQTALARVVIQRLRTVRDAVE